MNATAKLAAQAADLATMINTLSEGCVRDDIGKDLCNIASELTLLSTTICRLHEAMTANDSSYTDAFREDLEEITTELRLIFEEIDECCTELQKSNAPSLTTAAWFFRKGRVSRLQRHLEALKTTIVVMRTVLHHGKEYGVQISPGRLAESTPHTMSEDRAILESIFAKNRHAIVNSTAIGRKSTHSQSASAASDTATELSPGAHGRNLSFATGVEGITVADVLPPRISAKTNTTEVSQSLARRFSKRVGLGIHKSILEIQAEETEKILRRRWIKPDKLTETMPSIDERAVLEVGAATGDTVMPQTTAQASPITAKSRSNSLARIGSSMGKSLSRAIDRLSLGSQRDNKENVKTNGDHSISSDSEPKEASAATSVAPLSLRKPVSAKPALQTPGYSRELKNGDRT